MAKIKVRQTENTEETFARFLLVKRAEGISKKTAESYSQHFHAISKHLDVNRDIQTIGDMNLLYIYSHSLSSRPAWYLDYIPRVLSTTLRYVPEQHADSA